MEGSFPAVRCPQDGDEKGGENPGDHLCPHAETGALPEVLSCPKCCCAESLSWCSWGRIIQAESFLRGTKCSCRAGKDSPKAVSRAWGVWVPSLAEISRNYKAHWKSTARNPRRASAPAPSVCIFCPLLPCCAPSPKGDGNVLAETCANTACRAGQKPASHSQLSLLIMACATGANHVVIRRIYSCS